MFESLFVSGFACFVLRSLAEEEIKTEPDVVEGMDASARSKGKWQAEVLSSHLLSRLYISINPHLESVYSHPLVT